MGVKALWNLRNDDLYNFRWGNPEYTREYYSHMPLNVTAGMHMGSDGYVWARVWSEKKTKDADEVRGNPDKTISCSDTPR
eukprot:COSAG06_NODE_4414_length_4288_cov_33.741704_3_plen_80_part_00